ncbi:MAG: hypothetical protein HOI01_00240, partial [Proteobacteria bacterium]|nr:hypothetical protein [Pseudomonadota bacterium]
TAGTDYSGNTKSHTIAAGKTSTSWKLTGKADSKTEGNETIVINVTSVTNATENGTQRETLTLMDDDDDDDSDNGSDDDDDDDDDSDNGSDDDDDDDDDSDNSS